MSSINAFKELLLKKAQDNPEIQSIIGAMKDEAIIEKVLESLEKMARPHASMGRGANAGIVAFANQMKNKDVEQLRDALSHHVSHYKAALSQGKRAIADKHLNKIVPLMHLAARASGHSNGQLGLDYVPMEPWETNYTSAARFDQNGQYTHPNDKTNAAGKQYNGTSGKLIEGTKGLGRRPKNTDRSSNPRGVPDYRYLEMEPHGGHQDTKKSKHQGGYPFEEIQIGNPAKIDAGEAYLHTFDPGEISQYEPHPFDAHPVHDIADLKQDSMSGRMQKFADDMAKWHTSEHNNKWMQSLKDAHAKDPEAFKSRGKVKPAHHFEGIKLLDQPEEALSFKQNKVASPEAPAATPAAPVKTEMPKIDYSALPPSLRAKYEGK